MKLLLDTHVLLWAIDKPKLISPRVRRALLDESNELVSSVASAWEITLKVQAGKLTLPADPDFLDTHFRKLGVRNYLPVSISHVRQLGSLPLIHKDPFDRILVAQAVAEGLTLVSKDAVFREYPVPAMW